jgi:hypothetical protein
MIDKHYTNIKILAKYAFSFMPTQNQFDRFGIEPNKKK